VISGSARGKIVGVEVAAHMAFANLTRVTAPRPGDELLYTFNLATSSSFTAFCGVQVQLMLQFTWNQRP